MTLYLSWLGIEAERLAAAVVVVVAAAVALAKPVAVGGGCGGCGGIWSP